LATKTDSAINPSLTWTKMAARAMPTLTQTAPRAGRKTAAHSTAVLEGKASSQVKEQLSGGEINDGENF
jgi:hypothetical protein